MNTKLIFNNWKDIGRYGVPNDGDVCICLYEKNCKTELFIGEYSKQNHLFYNDFSFKRNTLKEDNVLKWAKTENFILDF